MPDLSMQRYDYFPKIPILRDNNIRFSRKSMYLYVIAANALVNVCA